ncbi:MAG: tetratricopeptide repeat protein [Alphaproteobacteria bacterium]
MEIKSVLIALVLSAAFAMPAAAGPFEDGFAAYKEGDYATALEQWRPLAEQDVAVAQYNIGVMYRNGEGVPQDYGEAVTWYRKAADQGYAPAQYNLGIRYRNGQGVQRDNGEAVNWYRLAAEQGLASAQNDLGLMYLEGLAVPQDFVLAHKWFNLSAAQGNESARENRDSIAERMTPAGISEAQRLAREWRPK